jgi:hypothetical protein
MGLEPDASGAARVGMELSVHLVRTAYSSPLTPVI